MAQETKCTVCGSPVGWGTPICPVCGSALEWQEIDEDQPDAHLMPPWYDDSGEEPGDRQPWEEYVDRLEGRPGRRKWRAAAAVGLTVAIILMVVLIVIWWLRVHV
ncbi:MAG: hypothetical protein JXJ17_18270 [Anaerolineae bacterium]|nr:hypothetical protein [Anaerolineae bacterium]